MVGDGFDLGQRECVDPHRRRHKYRFCGLASCHLENMVLLYGDVVGLFLLQGIEEEIEGRDVILIFFLYLGIFQHLSTMEKFCSYAGASWKSIKIIAMNRAVSAFVQKGSLSWLPLRVVA